MKAKIFVILVGVLGCLNIYSQNPVLSIDDMGWKSNINGAYYKDIGNEFDDFLGTWLFTQGSDTLKITLVKNEQYFNGNYYEDLVVGGYQYVANGVEKINTLADASIPNIGRNAQIWGQYIYKNCVYLPADDCINGEARLSLVLSEPNSPHHSASFILHKRTVNGQPALKAVLVFTYHKTDTPGVPTPSPTLPWQQTYVLIKQ